MLQAIKLLLEKTFTIYALSPFRKVQLIEIPHSIAMIL